MTTGHPSQLAWRLHAAVALILPFHDAADPTLECSKATSQDAHSAYVGSTFGGGSGAGIAIVACRVTLGRALIVQLLNSSTDDQKRKASQARLSMGPRWSRSREWWCVYRRRGALLLLVLARPSRHRGYIVTGAALYV